MKVEASVPHDSVVLELTIDEHGDLLLIMALAMTEAVKRGPEMMQIVSGFISRWGSAIPEGYRNEIREALKSV